jgi:hypothetical protein
LFGFGKAEQVVPLSFHEGLLSFSCSGKYKVGKSAKVKLTLVYGESIHTPTVSLTVVAFEPTPEGTFLCTGALDVSKSKLPELIMQMAYAGVEGADRRNSRRLPYTIRILSKELSSFRAVTSNINASGTELNCDHPVAPGHSMNLQFDLESVGFRELKMQAVCVWSAEEIDESRRSRYRVGVGFTNQHPDTHAAWTKFYRSILANEGASVMLKTMDGGSVADKKVDGVSVSAVIPPAPPPPPPPSASSSGQWTTPPTGNPFASQELQPKSQEGYGFNPPPAPGQPNALNFAAPPAAVPPPSQMGGGFNTQAAPPPPILPNKLQLPPASPGKQQQAGGPLRLPEASTQPSGFGAPSAHSSGGFQIPPVPPAQGSGFGAPPAHSSGGFQIPPVPPAQGIGFGAPPPHSSGGFQIPPVPPAQGGGFGAPSAHSSGGFQIPLVPPTQGGGFGAPSAHSSGGFQMPPSQPPQSGFGFPPAASSGVGFQIPPAPSSQSGFGFTPSQPSGGFQIPPAQPPQQSGFSFPGSPQQPGFPAPSSQPGGFGTPPSQPSGGFGFPASAPVQPQPVEPLGIRGSSLAYRCRQDPTCAPGARKQVQLSFDVGGRVTSVAINVSLTRVEPAVDGSCVCWCTVLEDEQKIQVLNQVLGS